jgi:hypothetical protein
LFLGDFIVFGRVLAPWVGVLLLANLCYIFTPAPDRMATLKFMLQIDKKRFSPNLTPRPIKMAV